MVWVWFIHLSGMFSDNSMLLQDRRMSVEREREFSRDLASDRHLIASYWEKRLRDVENMSGVVYPNAFNRSLVFTKS